MYEKEFYVLEYVIKFYQWQLINCDEALDYILPRLTDRLLLDEFEIGLAGSYNELYRELAHKFKELLILEDLQLIRFGKEEYYDVFKERIIFPIRDEFGNPVGFGGRALFHEEQQALKDKGTDVFVPAKYINSSATAIFNKSEVVYNLYKAKEHIKKMGFAYLAEGYTDVIAIHSSCRNDGIFRENVVGTLGTSLTYSQAEILQTYTKKVLLCYDGDSAGKEATLKAIEVFDKLGMTSRVALLPDGHDPASYLRAHDNLDILDNSLNKYQFKFSVLYDELLKYDLSTHYSYAVKHAIVGVSRIFKGASRTTMTPLVYLLSTLFGVEEVTLYIDLVISNPRRFASSFKYILGDLEDIDSYLIEVFNQSPDALIRDASTKLKRKEKIAYETMSKLFKS